jgi:hypothetical protein
MSAGEYNGINGGMSARTHRATGEALTALVRNRRRKVSPITRDTGKWTEGGRVADGPAVAMKQGDAYGAKRPYFWQSSNNIGRQG